MSLRDFFGRVLPASASPLNSVAWLDPLAALTGTLLSDKITGGGGGHVMSGLFGDDTYYVKVAGDLVVEGAGGGIDTAIVAGLKEYVLPDFVENLTVGGRADVLANGLDNIVTGLNNNQVLNGLGGNDILVGGGDADTFAFTHGSGYDAIADFTALDGDKIRLDDTTLATFADVRAAMTQDGADVILRFDANDAVRIQNTTVDAFTANDFQFHIDTSKLTQTFAEEFDASPSFYNPDTGAGVWDPYYNHGSSSGPRSALSHTNNDELEIYVDPSYSGSGTTPLGINPFSVDNGVLTITAAKTPADALGALWNHQYTSGLLTTADSFYQQYGYFEMRAAMPQGQGVWPAFWLLPADQTYGLELDVTEQVGTDTAYQTAHYWTDAVRQKLSYGNHVVDASQMHTYGMLWTAQEVAWYIDGVEVVSIPTPPDLNKPMYILANLAIGGQWPGAPPADFVSAQMKIDYIHAYAVDPNATAATVNAGGGTIGGVLTGTDGADSLIGSTINDTLHGLGGDDVLDGRAGPDTLDGGDGVDTATYAASVAAVHVSLAVTTAQDTGAAGMDTLVSVENLTGSAFNDQLTGDANANVLTGGAGDDVLNGGAGDDVLNGGGGNDTASYAGATGKVTVDLSIAGPQNTVGAGVDTLVGVENLVGSSAGDILSGDFGANSLDGGKGADTLNGGNGRDILTGAAGADILTGGQGSDTFVFAAKADSKGASFDRITDFSHADGDLIDLSAMDANKAAAGDQAFAFLGTGDFTHHAGELRYGVDSAGAHVYGDVNGDGVADFHILVAGLTTLLASDFIL